MFTYLLMRNKIHHGDCLSGSGRFGGALHCSQPFQTATNSNGVLTKRSISDNFMNPLLSELAFGLAYGRAGRRAAPRCPAGCTISSCHHPAGDADWSADRVGLSAHGQVRSGSGRRRWAPSPTPDRPTLPLMAPATQSRYQYRVAAALS